MTSTSEAPATAAGAPDLATLRRSQILHAAVVVIARDGADRARLKDVAAEARVSLGMVQHYFRTRDDLMAAAFETMMSLSARNWETLGRSAPDPLVHLFAGLRMHVYGSAPFAQRWGFWVELWSVARRDPALARTAHGVYERWAAPFTAALSALARLGEISTDESPEDLSVEILALIDGLAVRAVVDADALDVDAMHARLLAAASRSLGIAPSTAREADRAAQQWLADHVPSTPFSPGLLAGTLDH
jgi:TetR/AcrR family transcriptional repressor of bet genes